MEGKAITKRGRCEALSKMDFLSEYFETILQRCYLHLSPGGRFFGVFNLEPSVSFELLEIRISIGKRWGH